MLDQTIAHNGVSRTALERMVFATPDSAGMNACVACCDRWADGGRVGLDWFGCDDRMPVRTFDELRDDAARFANLLTARGIRPGDVVVGMLPRGAEMLTVILGTWRAGAVFQPVFTGFNQIAIAARINHTGLPPAKLIVTDLANRGMLGLVKFCPPVLVVTGNWARIRPGDGDFAMEMAVQSTNFTPVGRDGDDPFILLVGGRGGRMRPGVPKLRSLLAMLSCLRIGLEPGEAEIGWDVADPAWSVALYFSVIRPLLQGHPAMADASDRMMSSDEVVSSRSRPSHTMPANGDVRRLGVRRRVA